MTFDRSFNAKRHEKLCRKRIEDIEKHVMKEHALSKFEDEAPV
jgi:hypothetical protein